MKKVILTAILFATVFTSSVFATESYSVSKKVQKSFEQTFVNAKSVAWEKVSAEGIYHASFIMDQQEYHAYFSADGELVATCRSISTSYLPIIVSQSLGERFGSFAYKSAIELLKDGSTSYIVSLETTKHNLSVQVHSDGDVNIVKKEKK